MIFQNLHLKQFILINLNSLKRVYIYIYYNFIDDNKIDQIYKLYVKFRPGIKELLQLLFKYYELYIFSQGEKEYVLKILSYLDKDKYYQFLSIFIYNSKLFGNRVITRETLNQMGKTHKSFDILLDTVNSYSQYHKNMSPNELSRNTVYIYVYNNM